MWFFFSFIPATFWVVVGYFVLFSSSKTTGGVQLFGRILAVWVFLIAVFFLVGGAYLTFVGFPGKAMMHSG